MYIHEAFHLLKVNINIRLSEQLVGEYKGRVRFGLISFL